MTATATPEKAWNTTLEYIVGRKRAEQALGFLTTAGDRLTEAATLPEAIEGALGQAAPYLADWLSVSLTGSDATYAASSRGATADQDTYRSLSAALAGLTEGGRVPVALSAAESTVSPQQPGGAAELVRQAADAGVATAVAVPLTAYGRHCGLLTAYRVTGRRDPQFGEASMRLLNDLAGRLAGAALAFAAGSGDKAE
jgi:hypothetical protein